MKRPLLQSPEDRVSGQIQVRDKSNYSLGTGQKANDLQSFFFSLTFYLSQKETRLK